MPGRRRRFSLSSRTQQRREDDVDSTRLTLDGGRLVGAGLLANPVDQHRIRRLTRRIRRQAGSSRISPHQETGQAAPHAEEAVNQIPLSARSIAK